MLIRKELIMFEKFINQINKYGALDESEIKYLREHSKINFYKKSEIILSCVNIQRYVYFVLDGCVRLFYNVDGKDKTAFFYNEGDFIWTHKQQHQEILIQKNYEAIKNTVIVQIDKIAVLDLIKRSSNFQQIVRIEKEQELIAYQQLLAYFITLSAEERFIKLLETNNSLFQRVPQQYIASYLGVSAETLSRIKKRVYTKNY